ncbi:MAG: hypothetical protein PWP44_465 [Thermacetogenium sp.]|uniref:Uncharacterized protein n=1 Tax=Thermacetogenium phaeum TaxID=85874 RepID=A0A117LBG0_9THEO|nr:MAG: hypothetical protein XD66_0387 [Thermacetogenium phaeum]MDN5365262.1 hypothetical protein [Thermacetogenium sp.]MDN5376549.1 hypothetical protein [Thermacetogenium sp.]
MSQVQKPGYHGICGVFSFLLTSIYRYLNIVVIKVGEEDDS